MLLLKFLILFSSGAPRIHWLEPTYQSIHLATFSHILCLCLSVVHPSGFLFCYLWVYSASSLFTSKISIQFLYHISLFHFCLFYFIIPCLFAMDGMSSFSSFRYLYSTNFSGFLMKITSSGLNSCSNWLCEPSFLVFHSFWNFHI